MSAEVIPTVDPQPVHSDPGPDDPGRAVGSLPAIAFHGIAGEVVRALEPTTEADPAGLLLTFLAAAGAALGPGPHALADGAQHPARLNVVLVGRSARARKGTSWAVMRRVLSRADPLFFGTHVLGGLASGEGLVAALQAGEDGPDPTTAGWTLVHEPEFARLLRVASRSASLSSIIREAWDSGELSVVTRKEPLYVSGAHVGILGHVTGEELVRSLKAVEIANGMANRFLFCSVHRSKRLPFGGSVDEDTLEDLAAKVGMAIWFGRKLGQIDRTPAARTFWARLYDDLDDNVSGVVGSLTARAEAQILRIAVTFAALDGGPDITVTHLQAAQAVWQYCEASVVELFADRPADDVLAQRLLQALSKAPNGLDGTQQRDLFARHASGEQLAAARRDLERRNLIETRTEQTGGRPRLVSWLLRAQVATEAPRELWSPTSPIESEPERAPGAHSSLTSETAARVRLLSGSRTTPEQA